MNRRTLLRSAGALAAGCASGAAAAGMVEITIPSAQAATETPIALMTAELHARFKSDTASLSDDEADVAYGEFNALLERIIRAEPLTPRDVALQFLADTHFGDTDNSEEFRDRLLAMGGIGGAA